MKIDFIQSVCFIFKFKLIIFNRLQIRMSTQALPLHTWPRVSQSDCEESSPYKWDMTQHDAVERLECYQYKRQHGLQLMTLN